MTEQKFLGPAVKILFIVLLVFVGLTAWLLYGNPFAPAKLKAYQILPVPIAIVGAEPVFMKDFLRSYELAKTFNLLNGKLDDSLLKKNVLENLIRQKKLEEKAASLGVKVSQKELDAEYQRKKDFSLKAENQSLESLLNSAGLTPEDFKQLILKPDLLATNLTIWFNGQEKLNSEALGQAQEIKRKLGNGASFLELAKSQSQDNAGKLLEGDMGFIESSQLLPELQGGLDAMAAGESKIFASRYGVHLIKLAEKDNRGEGNAARIHLFQIFISPANFQQWYEGETKNIRVQNIININ